MKKFIVSILPIIVLLFLLIWFSWGLEGALVSSAAVLFSILLVQIIMIWVKFVDKHIKD